MQLRSPWVGKEVTILFAFASGKDTKLIFLSFSYFSLTRSNSTGIMDLSKEWASEQRNKQRLKFRPVLSVIIAPNLLVGVYMQRAK